MAWVALKFLLSLNSFTSCNFYALRVATASLLWVLSFCIRICVFLLLLWCLFLKECYYGIFSSFKFIEWISEASSSGITYLKPYKLDNYGFRKTGKVVNGSDVSLNPVNSSPIFTPIIIFILDAIDVFGSFFSFVIISLILFYFNSLAACYSLRSLFMLTWSNSPLIYCSNTYSY